LTWCWPRPIGRNCSKLRGCIRRSECCRRSAAGRAKPWWMRHCGHAPPLLVGALMHLKAPFHVGSPVFDDFQTRNHRLAIALLAVTGGNVMQTLLGMILGALLLVAGVYIYDSMSTSTVANGQVAGRSHHRQLGRRIERLECGEGTRSRGLDQALIKISIPKIGIPLLLLFTPSSWTGAFFCGRALPGRAARARHAQGDLLLLSAAALRASAMT
jgi:hypothetical protein